MKIRYAIRVLYDGNIVATRYSLESLEEAEREAQKITVQILREEIRDPAPMVIVEEFPAIGPRRE